MTGGPARRVGARSVAVVALLLALLVPALVLAGIGGRPGDAQARPRPTATANPTPTPGATRAPGTIDGRVVVSAVTLDFVVVPLAHRRGPRTIEGRVTVVNQSRQQLATAEVGLRGDAGLFLQPVKSQTLRRIAPGATGSAAWQLCATTPGTYSLIAFVVIDGTTFTGTPRAVTVTTAMRC